MGVPVITLTKASNHAHSVGGTLLSRIKGLEEFVATTEAEYVEKAVALATNKTKLSATRRNMRGSMLKSPVCDGKSFTKGLEDTYHDIWRRHLGESEDKTSSKDEKVSISSPTSSSPTPSAEDGNEGGEGGDKATTTSQQHLALLHELD